MKPTIRRAAEEDILREIGRYVMLDLPQVAINFQIAIIEALDLLCLTPEAGAPRLVPNPKLEGLRTWPIRGFDAFRTIMLPSRDHSTSCVSFTDDAKSHVSCKRATGYFAKSNPIIL